MVLLPPGDAHAIRKTGNCTASRPPNVLPHACENFQWSWQLAENINFTSGWSEVSVRESMTWTFQII